MTTPFVTKPFPEVSGLGTVLVGEASVRHSPLGWWRARLPLGFAVLDFPAGAQVRESVVGNLELGLEHEFALGSSTRLGFTAAFLVPSAEHGTGTALLGNRALALVGALNGGKDSALLTPGVTGLLLGVVVERVQHPFTLRASLDAQLLLRLSDASLPDETQTRSLGMAPVVELEGALSFTSWFAASLGAGLVTELLRVQEPARERDRGRRVQPVSALGCHFSVHRHATLGLQAIVPVGGNLGGDAWSLGPYGRFAF